MAINRVRWVYRFAAATALFHLAWEILQLPLYTLWADGSAYDITFAVLHCTVGDLMIAGSSLLAAVVLVRPREWPQRRSVAVVLCTLVFGFAYTAYSEWYNTTVTHDWAYSTLMPTIAGIGIAPLLQWLLVPCAAFWWALRPSHAS